MKNKGIVKVVEVWSEKNRWEGSRRYWHSRQKGYNGKTLYPSETYRNKATCLKTARAIAKQLGVKVKVL